MAKASLPAGLRDFSPEEVYKRNFIFDHIKEAYETYGYQPIETPAMESVATLTEKYGEEGDQLLYRILNSGDYLKKAPDELLETKDYKMLLSHISDKGLRYDLTVPFARFVAMNKNKIVFPFKRYQVQSVWRADKPQKGRYREFYQCDADVIGSNSLMYEAEFILLFDEVFSKLNISDVSLKINNRKILYGIAESMNFTDKFTDFTIALDKMDKVGIDGVKKELEHRGIDPSVLDQLAPALEIDSGKINDILASLEDLLSKSETGMKGLEECREVYSYVQDESFKSIGLGLDLTLARGLNYYTGMIFEAVPNNVKMGSIAGGGRYDDLTSYFGLPDVSGVGFTFGVERIYDLMNELGLFPDLHGKQTKVFLINFGQETEKKVFKILNELRSNGISAELHPAGKNIGKQFKYADKRDIPHVLSIGTDELNSGSFVLKNMESGTQENLSLEAIISKLK